MTTIKKGFDDKKTTLKFHARPEERLAELWIEQKGLPVKETLSFMSIDELLDLRDEIEGVLATLILD